ncbi:hypothetical protein KUCAC02_016364, partial [Chaenocephalus aceratus]
SSHSSIDSVLRAGPAQGDRPRAWPPHIKGSLWRMLIFAQVHLAGLLSEQRLLRAYKYQRPKRRLVTLSLCV